MIKSIFQQQFGEYHEYDGCYSIYFDSSTIVRLSGLKSLHFILAQSGNSIIATVCPLKSS